MSSAFLHVLPWFHSLIFWTSTMCRKLEWPKQTLCIIFVVSPAVPPSFTAVKLGKVAKHHSTERSPCSWWYTSYMYNRTATYKRKRALLLCKALGTYWQPHGGSEHTQWAVTELPSVWESKDILYEIIRREINNYFLQVLFLGLRKSATWFLPFFLITFEAQHLLAWGGRSSGNKSRWLDLWNSSVYKK